MKQQLLLLLCHLPPSLLRAPLDGLSFWVGSTQVVFFHEDGLYGVEVEDELAVVWETRAATPEALLEQLRGYLCPIEPLPKQHAGFSK